MIKETLQVLANLQHCKFGKQLNNINELDNIVDRLVKDLLQIFFQFNSTYDIHFLEITIEHWETLCELNSFLISFCSFSVLV